MMPPQPSDWGARGAANTAPANSQNTSPVYGPPGGYQPSMPPMYPQAIPPYTPPRKRSPVGWILAFIGMGLFVAVVVAVMLIARAGRRAFSGAGPSGPVVPAAPQAGESALEASADQSIISGSDTILTKTFAMTPGSKFSIKNISGSITVGTWDQPKAEVRVVKRGSDRGTQIFFTNSANNLALRTGISGTNNQDVRYEIMLPREMERIDLKSVNGSVKISNATGQILVESVNGSIELNDVGGVSKIQTNNGKITATLKEASDGPMEFVTVNGKLDVTINCDFDAELDASTVHGNLTVDDQLSIPVQKEVVGQRAHGQLGSGGQPLKLTAVNGSVKLSRQCEEAK